ncbi:EpsG family protein [Flavobacterium sp. P21]|uniref:EpsG family protein n=1 Tax=Flavobacterium sp. P21 TaxID=3423948 RepID=UPI003D673850
MEVYFTTLLLIFFCAALELRCTLTSLQRNIFLLTLYIFIVVQIGLRWETGTDWNTYLDHFNDVDDISLVFLNALIGFEIGYGFLTFAIHKIFENYSVFLFLHALFFYGVIFKACRQFSPYTFVSLLFFMQRV